jgi:DNA repair protein RadC
MRVVARRLARAEVNNQPVIASWSDLMDYIRVTIGHDDVEAFHVLFLNHAHILIRDDTVQKGTPNNVPIYCDQIVRRALEVGASAVIVCHNHPSSDCTPSPADIEITIKLVNALATVNIAMHDHIIVSKSGHYSFRTHKLL